MTDKPLVDRDLVPIPYEDGDHCIFYAVQAASMYFNNQPLTLKNREEYEELHKRTVDLTNILVDKKDDLFTVSIIVALRNIDSILKPMGIHISSISSTEDILKRIQKDNFIQRERIDTTIVNDGDMIDQKFPILVFSHRDIGFHVWCPTSKEEFNNGISKNVFNEGITLTAQLLKRTIS